MHGGSRFFSFAEQKVQDPDELLFREDLQGADPDSLPGGAVHVPVVEEHAFPGIQGIGIQEVPVDPGLGLSHMDVAGDHHAVHICGEGAVLRVDMV